MDISLTVKKKIFFTDYYDYNYLAYHLLIVLSEFDCNCEIKAFSYHEILPVLFELMNNKKAQYAFLRHDLDSSEYTISEKAILHDLYLHSKTIEKQLIGLINFLSKKGLIGSKFKKNGQIATWLIDQPKIQALLNDPIFDEEKNTIIKIKTALKRLRISTKSNVFSKIFTSKGVDIWDI